MPTPLSRRNLLHAAVAFSAPFVAHRSQACEYFAPTLRVTHPWTRATPASAGFAVLGMRFDDVSQDDQLLDVQTPVAKSVVLVRSAPSSVVGAGVVTVALPLDIPAGSQTVLGQADGGLSGPHLRLLGLTQDLEAGRSYPLQLVFKHGGSVKAQLNVDYARFA